MTMREDKEWDTRERVPAWTRRLKTGARAAVLLTGVLFALPLAAAPESRLVLPVSTVADKIRGGLMGHLLGDLNGLKHEMKYIAEPGNVTEYTPALPDGAWTDDDTDFEWVYVVAAHERGLAVIPQKEIPALWKKHINRAFWCANQYARQLMDLGLEPPLTGSILFNPWSDFNISGQFVCESWGLIAPGMPRTAARIGLNYTRVAIEGEPAQATQLFTAMIAAAFLTNDLGSILDVGELAVDPKSEIRQIVRDVRAWHKQQPDDWWAVRQKVKGKYSRHNGAMRDKNGHELNTASVIAALLFGQGDYLRTSITAFNFGWDADNNAATACTVVGVIKGQRWMQSQGWQIKDVYRNTSRDALPMDETITRFGDRLVALAERTIIAQGGKRILQDGQDCYEIPAETPANFEALIAPKSQREALVNSLGPQIEQTITGTATTQAKALAAYEAIALGLAPDVRQRHPQAWAEALSALKEYPKAVQALFFEAGVPAGDALRQQAVAAGLEKPAKREKLW